LHLIIFFEGSVLEGWRLPLGPGLGLGSGGGGSRRGSGTVPPEAFESLCEVAALRAAALAFDEASPPLAASDDAAMERDGGSRG
jgi:hypothetical protein